MKEEKYTFLLQNNAFFVFTIVLARLYVLNRYNGGETMLDRKMLGYRIKEYRLRSGLSQAALAKSVHIQPSTLCEYEAGRITPSIKVLVDIANVLNCTADALLLDSVNGNKLTLEDASEERLNEINKLIDTLNE